MKKIKLIFPLIALFSLTIIAQTDNVKNEPGYVDFGDLAQFESSTGVTEVILDEDLLSILAQISTDDDPNVMAIMEGLKLVKANVFEVSEETESDLKSKINSIDSKLSGTDWKRIVKTRSEDELANVYIKHNNNKQIIGLVVTSMESSGEAAFVNIVGTIDLATIGKLGKQFNIPQLDGMKNQKEDDDEN
ncbi:MAG: DUF4252 domain-containing protein [Ignavibacteria bacterium]|nr:DUF4252 domain-containing protein [Ignavibacteria bacterium]